MKKLTNKIIKSIKNRLNFNVGLSVKIKDEYAEETDRYFNNKGVVAGHKNGLIKITMKRPGAMVYVSWRKPGQIMKDNL